MRRFGATTRAVVAGVLAGLGFFAPAARACHPGAECRPDDPLGVVGRLPQCADAVVVIESGASQRVSPAGRALGSFLGESGLFKETASAWCSLAQSLRLSPEQAFDLTLGQRAIVVIDGLFENKADGLGHTARWALLSHVCPRTEVLIRESLRPAPRSIEQGRPILALENGAYELATSPACRRMAGDNGSMILLAPAKDSQLFDSLLPVLNGGVQGPTLSQCGSWEHAAKLGGGDLLVYLRRTRGAGRPEDFLVCSAQCTSSGWTAKFTASAALMWDSAGGVQFPDVRMPAGLDRLAQGAMALYCGPLAWGSEGGGRSAFALGLPIPHQLPTGLTGMVGPTIVAALHGDGPVGPGQSGAVSLSLAVQTSDLEGTAALGDRLLARLVARHGAPSKPAVELVAARTAAPARGEPAVEAVDFSRLGRGEPRVVQLRDDECGVSECGRTILSWSYVAGADSDLPGNSPGWWLINLLQGSSGGAAAERTARDALGVMGTGVSTPVFEGGALVSRACIRPDRIAGALGPGAPAPCGGFVRSLRWIESVGWEVGRAEGGLVAGSVSVRMKPDPAP